jgi:hypothetical protein
MQKKAQDTLLQGWGRLIRAVRKHQAELDGIAPFRDALERAYTQALFNRRRRDVTRAAAREAVRELQKSLDTAYDASVSVRSFIKSVLGFRSEKLREFGITPRLGCARKSKKPAPGFELPS